MAAPRDTSWIAEQARTVGFDLCGVARAEAFPELAHLPEWLASGYGGQMRYLADPRRESASSTLAGARSLIVCGLVYNTAHPRTSDAMAAGNAEAPHGWISRYAWGADYHAVVGERLERLVAAMRAGIAEPFEARPYVDTGPLSERVAAKYAGLGWLGKNTMLIHPQIGSWFFLGVVVTTLELTPSLGLDEPPQPDLCGHCTLCLDACPTGAFVEPGVMDARRCISYLTIEHRGSIAEELRPLMGAHVYGCDICQDVCPYNGRAPVSALAEFQPRPDLFAPSLEWLASLTVEEYQREFRGSAMKRAKYQGLVRNACIALGNSTRTLAPQARERVRVLLARLSASPDAVIAEHAASALLRFDALGGASAGRATVPARRET